MGWPQSTQLRLYVIGDSTASPYDGSTYPRKGWSQVFQDFFDRDEAKHEVSLDMGAYPAGGYYLRVERSDDQGWYKIKH